MRRFYLNFVGNAHFSYFVSLLFWLFIVLRTKKNSIFFFVASMEWGATAQRMTDLVGSILLIQTWSGTQSILLRLVDPYEKCIFRWLLFFTKAMAFCVWAFQSRTTRETDDWVRILLQRGWYGCCCLFFSFLFLMAKPTWTDFTAVSTADEWLFLDILTHCTRQPWDRILYIYSIILIDSIVVSSWWAINVSTTIRSCCELYTR